MDWEVQYSPEPEGDWIADGSVPAADDFEAFEIAFAEAHDGAPVSGYYRIRPAGSTVDWTIYTWGTNGRLEKFWPR